MTLAALLLFFSWAIAAAVRKCQKRPHWQERLDELIRTKPIFRED